METTATAKIAAARTASTGLETAPKISAAAPHQHAAAGEPCLEVRQLTVCFPSRHGTTVAVEDVSLQLRPGEILGVVGESGAGKSTIGSAAIGLLEPPGEIAKGEIYLHGQRIDTLAPQVWRPLRGRQIAMIFQDPLTSLNPLQTIARQLIETMRTHLPISQEEAARRAVDLLRRVGIPEAEQRVLQYPHQFSGGMRQRVVIALALCAEPRVIIADEPTTALDVSIQAQILELMKGLVREQQVGMILITHDMGVIAEVSDRVAVMYRGRLIEEGSAAKILGAPDHPYTRSLIATVPRADRRLKRFPVASYIEAAADSPPPLDLKTHWLGQARPETREAQHRRRSHPAGARSAAG